MTERQALREEDMSSGRTPVKELSWVSSKDSNQWTTDHSRFQLNKSDPTFTNYTSVTNGYNSGSYQPKWSTSSFKANINVNDDLGWGSSLNKGEHIQIEANKNTPDDSFAEKRYSDLKYFDERRYNSRRHAFNRYKHDLNEDKQLLPREISKDRRHYHVNNSTSNNNERRYNKKLNSRSQNNVGNNKDRVQLLKRYSSHRKLTRPNDYNNDNTTQEVKTDNLPCPESNFQLNQRNTQSHTNPESLTPINSLHHQSKLWSKTQKYTLPSKATNNISEHPLLHSKPQLDSNELASNITVKKRRRDPDKPAISRKVRKVALSSSEEDYSSSEELNDSPTNKTYTTDPRNLPKVGLTKISTEKLRKISGSAEFAKESISLNNFKPTSKGNLFDDEIDQIGTLHNSKMKIKSCTSNDKTNSVSDENSADRLHVETRNGKTMTSKGSLFDDDSDSLLNTNNTNSVATKGAKKSVKVKGDLYKKKQYNGNFEEVIKPKMELYKIKPLKKATRPLKIKRLGTEYNQQKTIKPITPKKKHSEFAAIKLVSSDNENTSFQDVSPQHLSKQSLNFREKSDINQNIHVATMKNNSISNIASNNSHISQYSNQEPDNKDSNTSLPGNNTEVSIDSRDEFFDAEEYINTTPNASHEKNSFKLFDENKHNVTSHLFVQDEENASDSFSQLAEKNEPLTDTTATELTNKSHEKSLEIISDNETEDIQILKITKHKKKDKRDKLKQPRSSQVGSANRLKGDKNVFLQKKLKGKKEKQKRKLQIKHNEYKGVALEERSKLNKRRNIVRPNNSELIVLDSE